jgi:hypothetical protein
MPREDEMSTSQHWTEPQQRFFDTFGFIRFPGLFADQIGAVTDEFEAVWARLGGHRPIYMPFIDQSELLSSLVDDPRLHDIAVSVLGDDFNYMGCNAHCSVGETGWHHDGREGLRFLRFFFYLDSLTAESGALRVIPGSHRLGDAFANSLVRLISREEDLSAEQHRVRSREDPMADIELEAIFGVGAAGIPAFPIENTPGDVILFDHRIMHAALGSGEATRRFFTINLSERAVSEPRVDDMRDWVKFHLRIAKPERLVAAAMVDTATPERMRHLEQVIEHQEELRELVLAEAD